jgi:hypothetical protein
MLVSQPLENCLGLLPFRPEKPYTHSGTTTSTAVHIRRPGRAKLRLNLPGIPTIVKENYASFNSDLTRRPLSMLDIRAMVEEHCASLMSELAKLHESLLDKQAIDEERRTALMADPEPFSLFDEI